MARMTKEAGLPRAHVLNNLGIYLEDLRARAARGEPVRDRIRATEARIQNLKRRGA